MKRAETPSQRLHLVHYDSLYVGQQQGAPMFRQILCNAVNSTEPLIANCFLCKGPAYGSTSR